MNGTGVSHTGKGGSVHTTHWFVRITQDKAFQTASKARWAEERGTFEVVGTSGVDAAATELGTNAAADDRAFWQSSNPPDRNTSRANSYNGEVDLVKNWYEARDQWMNGRIG